MVLPLILQHGSSQCVFGFSVTQEITSVSLVCKFTLVQTGNIICGKYLVLLSCYYFYVYVCMYVYEVYGVYMHMYVWVSMPANYREISSFVTLGLVL